MILLLLLLAFVLGVVDPQTANVTKTESGEVERNRTFREFVINNGTMKLHNVSEIEEELQKNQTSPGIREDDESFQDQEKAFPGRRCDRAALVLLSRTICREEFNTEMTSVGKEDWCYLEKIIRAYNELTICMENLSNLAGCYYPNQDAQDFFLEIHSFYFQDCSDEELLLEDAPQAVVVVLTLIPVSLIPVLVYLVVWKGKVQE